MNVLILTPDRVGSTLLQRLITVYANINDPDAPTVNLHELTNGLAEYDNHKYGPLLGKKEHAWGYHQSLKQIVDLLSASEHGITSRLAYYHIKNRKDPIGDQLSFYEYLNNNFYIVAARRRNLFEHAVSWGISVESKKLNVYTFEEKHQVFKDIYAKGINIDQNTMAKYLKQYDEYTNWVDSHFNVNAYFDYEDHLPNIEQFILNLNVFAQAGLSKTWEDHFGIAWNDWNRMHYLLSLNPFGQQFTQEERDFIKANIERYTSARVVIQDMQDDGLMVSGIPIKLQTLAEKSRVVHNLEHCLDTYNKWIAHTSPPYAIEYKPNELADIALLENQNWKFGNIDTSSQLTYNDVSDQDIKRSDLKQ
jgi:hypothetical protein